MRKIILFAGAIIAAGTSAHAADLTMPIKAPPFAPAFSWSGCYVGGHVGWGWSQSTVAGFPNAGRAFAPIAVGPAGFAPGQAAGSVSIDFDTSGALFGGQLGCDYQAGNFVIGAAGSASAADISGIANQPQGTTGTAKTDGLFDVSGRLGYAWAAALIYAKGGWAWAHDQVGLSTLVTTATLSGGLAGGGIEWSFAPSWSAFVEYDHYFLRDRTINFIAVNIVPNQETLSQSIDLVKVGVNYRVRAW